MTLLNNLDYNKLDLDNLVTDSALKLASSINNNGKEAQINFLKNRCGLSEKEILEILHRKQ